MKHLRKELFQNHDGRTKPEGKFGMTGFRVRQVGFTRGIFFGGGVPCGSRKFDEISIPKANLN